MASASRPEGSQGGTEKGPQPSRLLSIKDRVAKLALCTKEYVLVCDCETAKLKKGIKKEVDKTLKEGDYKAFDLEPFRGEKRLIMYRDSANKSELRTESITDGRNNSVYITIKLDKFPPDTQALRSKGRLSTLYMTNIASLSRPKQGGSDFGGLDIGQDIYYRPL